MKRNGGMLYRNLRIMPIIRWKRYNTRNSRDRLPRKRPLTDRPIKVQARLVLGHWEGDAVTGRDYHHCIVHLSSEKADL